VIARAALFVALAAATCGASAAVMGVVESGGATIRLHDTKGPCVGDAHRAEYVSPAGDVIPGCWTPQPANASVFVVFFDGDIARIPLTAIKPK
jgi:hypothetical protein